MSDKSPSSFSREQIAEKLELLVPGRVRFDRHHQMLYATDASIYQVEPIGVVVPGSIEDVRKIVGFCGMHKVALLPRGGGTSLAGQCTNHAVVMDYSGACRKLLSVDVAGRTCHTEPGVTVDELNRHLEAQNTGLFYAPDPATSAQASIGGCIGNNAAGSRSIRYGRTAENVAGVDVALTSGERCWLEAGAGRRDATALRLAQQMTELVRRYEPLIRQRFPKTMRRNAGYALDLVLQQLDRGVAPEDMDLSGLICGSEGTLAVVLTAKLKLHPVPRSKGLAIASFASVDEAINAVAACVGTGACAVELIDDVVLTAARGNAQCRRYMELLPKVNGQEPQAVLYVEYQETGPLEDLLARFEQLKRTVPDVAVACYHEKGPLAQLWALRKAGEPLLHGLAGHRKPVTCVEDNAVPLENLVQFVKGFKEIVAKHGTKAAYYAHASVGVLHVRPLLDLHDPADRDRLRGIATEVADWARECGGVMSGEHGDGRIRGPLLERYFGPELMQAFRETKRIFDPAWALNPGMITDIGPIESITQNLRLLPGGKPLAWPAVETYFDYSDQEGFSGAVEMCNGAGVCRKTAVGVMCPSYRATLDERHSTRGRGNALRLAITGQLPGNGAAGRPAWNDPETMATLDLCLSCKACKSECPSNVDMARLKAEYTAQRYKEDGVPLQARVFGHVRTLNKIGSIAPGLANFINRLGPVRAIVNRVLGIAPQRSLPPFGRSLYHWFNGHDSPSEPDRPLVLFFADCFTTYNEPHIGQQAIRVLEALGYRVAMPQVGCCGRSMISNGLLADAIRAADENLEVLQPFIDEQQVKAIIVCEPSCLSTMKDEWIKLKLRSDMGLRQRVAERAMMFEEFVNRFWDEHPTRPRIRRDMAERPLVLHGHCHQKAMLAEEATAGLLRRLAKEKLNVLPSGCCGMAGAFGYTAERYEISMKIGEQSLFELVRKSPADAVIVAPGTSCRHQIRDGTGRQAVHPAEVAAKALLPENV